MMLASFAFAQLKSQQPKFSDDSGLFPKSKPVRDVNTTSKGTNAIFWFDYSELLEHAKGEPLEYWHWTMLQDSVATVNFTGGDPGRPQVYSLAQVYDFNDPIWDEYYGYPEGDPIALRHTPSFTIEEINIPFFYKRCTPANIVDTLVITIVAPTKTFEYLKVDNDYRRPTIRYNIPSATIPEHTDYPKYYSVKIPLTTADTSGSQYSEVTIPIPQTAGFVDMTNKQFAIAYSYISGVKNRTISSVIGENINRFAGPTSSDFRSDFQFICSTSSIYGAGFMNETNTSMCAMVYSVWNWASSNYNTLFRERYINNAEWCGYVTRPWIGVLISCDECSLVSVEDMESKKITVAPNPATNVFKVILADDSAAQIELYNLVGQKVYSESTNSSTVSVNVGNFNAGIYMLKVSQGGKVQTSKVVVK